MIRRILLIGVFAYVTVLISRASKKRAADRQKDESAREDWDSEGGTPPPDPGDTPITG